MVLVVRVSIPTLPALLFNEQAAVGLEQRLELAGLEEQVEVAQERVMPQPQQEQH